MASRRVRALARAVVISVVLLAAAGPARAGDWPTYRHDNRRSGVTAESLAVERLRPVWVWKSPGPPRPAWAGPAKWDAYAGIRGLRSMRDYDKAFHVIAVGKSVYFGSSFDDAVHCLDARTGKERWVYFTDAPVRVPPSFFAGRLFFGSDDGHAYSVDARSGKLRWKRAPTPSGRLIVHNGRMIPLSPCRTGVLVDAGTAYFANSLLPWRSSWLSAVDVASGEPTGDGRYVRELRDVTFEGALLASKTRLIAPQGRVAPLLFSRADGAKRGSLEGGGGCFVLVTPDSRILHGPGNKTGWITSSQVETRTRVATFKDANAMVVVGNAAFLLSDRSLAGLDRSKKKPQAVWKVDCESSFSLIYAGGALFVGGSNEVAAFDARSGEKIWTGAVEGRAHGLAVANGTLLVSTDLGNIHAFRRGAKRGRVANPRTGPRAEAKPGTLATLTAPPDRIEGLHGRWLFQNGSVNGRKVKDLVGKIDGAIVGTPRLQVLADDSQALELDGETHSVTLLDDHKKGKLPTRTISAEAWVRVDRAQSWGGIVGAFQDNGSYEKGWLLGYTGSKFSFAVSAVEGPPKLEYVAARTPFEAGSWHHVVGTYDGEEIRIHVDGKLEGSSRSQRGDIDYPPRAFYEIGAYHDDDENFRLAGSLQEVWVYDRALGAEEIATRARSRALRSPEVEVLDLAAGPFLRFTGLRRAVVRWETHEPSDTTLRWGESGVLEHSVAGEASGTVHEASIDNFVPGSSVAYAIEVGEGDEMRRSTEFECDSFFNFELDPVGEDRNPLSTARMSRRWPDLARRALEVGGVDRGICVVHGITDGGLAYELLRRSRLRVIGVDTDGERIERAREQAYSAGVQGDRLTFLEVDSLDSLPFTSCFANLVLSERALAGGKTVPSSKEMERIARPQGGIIFPGASLGKEARIVRGGLEGAGEWSHQYGAADNSAFGEESLAGARGASDLDVQWIGRPGPRAQPDRNGRKPSPLSTGGRLFVQGLERIIALDAFNGSILWSWEIPPLGRFNLPRDCSNWCADDEFVYVVIGDRCWRLDAATGRLAGVTRVGEGVPDGEGDDWGYVARVGDKLLGSAVRKGSSFKNFWGQANEGWYDAKSGPATYKVTSDSLFARYPWSGELKWRYAGGVIINSTIAVSDGKVYFVECRNRKILDSQTRRVGAPELWQDQHLVALDVDSGARLWEKPIDTHDGVVVFYLAARAGKIAIVSSGGGRYHSYVHDGDTGEPLWDAGFGWAKGHHGEHMARPAIVGSSLYVRPLVYDLATGKPGDKRMPSGGCGTYAASAEAFFYRNGNVTVWDPRKGKVTSWSRLRPDCWLSTIPAAGMLLSPEAGGGCSCGSWMETSVGFIPRSRSTSSGGGPSGG